MVGWWVVKRVQRCKWVGRWAKAKRQAVRDKRLMPGIVGSSQRVKAFFTARTLQLGTRLGQGRCNLAKVRCEKKDRCALAMEKAVCATAMKRKTKALLREPSIQTQFLADPRFLCHTQLCSQSAQTCCKPLARVVCFSWARLLRLSPYDVQCPIRAASCSCGLHVVLILTQGVGFLTLVSGHADGASAGRGCSWLSRWPCIAIIQVVNHVIRTGVPHVSTATHSIGSSSFSLVFGFLRQHMDCYRTSTNSSNPHRCHDSF